MKEKLSVRNFSVIDHADIDIRGIDILIGPQAGGKSLLAKLVYFFKTIPLEMYAAIISGEGKRYLENGLRTKFNRIFPYYLLESKGFHVTYWYGDRSISITNNNTENKKKAKNHKGLTISYSGGIMEIFGDIRKEYRKEADINVDGLRFLKAKLDVSLAQRLEALFGIPFKFRSVFIPAGRSFFINVAQNIFALLSQPVSLDYMLEQFGTFYQYVKERFGTVDGKGETNKREITKELYDMCAALLGGEYFFDRAGEWIKATDGRTIKLKDSSSGQQEVAPLLLSLLEFSTLPKEYVNMFIEEPETHLFPGAQKSIVDIVATVYHHYKKLDRKQGFFITTHSPYILTAFNNLIQAENTYRDIRSRFKSGESGKQEEGERLRILDRTVPPDRRIAFEDIAVYLVKDGTCRDIKNHEEKLIDANDIDTVSNSTAAVFDTLLDLSFDE